MCLNNRIFNKLNLIYKTEGKKSCKGIELFRWQCKWVDQTANNAMPWAWMKRTFFSSNAFNSYVFDGNVRNFTSPNWNWNLDMIIAVVVIQIEFQFNLHRRQRGRNALNSFHFQLIQLKWIRTKCDCGTGIVIQECDIIVYLCGNEWMRSETVTKTNRRESTTHLDNVVRTHNTIQFNAMHVSFKICTGYKRPRVRTYQLTITAM